MIAEFLPLRKCALGLANVNRTCRLIGPDAHPQPDSFTAVVAARLQSVCHLAFPLAVSTTTILPVLLCWNAFFEPDGDGLPRTVKEMLFTFVPHEFSAIPPAHRDVWVNPNLVGFFCREQRYCPFFVIAYPVAMQLHAKPDFLYTLLFDLTHTFLHFVSIP